MITQNFRGDSDNSSDNGLGKISKKQVDEMKKNYPKLNQQQIDSYSSMIGEDLQGPVKVSEESFPKAPRKDFNAKEKADNFAKKAKALDKLLVAKAKDNGVNLPPLDERIKIAEGERKKMASNHKRSKP